MKRRRVEEAFASCLRLLETTLSASTMSGYRSTSRWFLDYLRRRFPEVARPGQLERDPHLLGWLEELWNYRSAKGSHLNSSTRGAHVRQLRVLLETMEELADSPRPRLLLSTDIPKSFRPLPRPLSPEDDARLRRYWESATAPGDCALYLMRLTGIRIGECVDLAPDCMRHLGNQRWSLHVPLGKPRSERWVPLDGTARELVHRLGFLRTIGPAADPHFLLARPAGRVALMGSLRQRLRAAAAEAGVQVPVVPHQLRHTYATSLLRAGVSLPALMKLLGHHSADMTLIYVEVTQQDLHNEYHAALAHPRYTAPRPPVPVESAAPLRLEDALAAAIALIDHRLSSEATPKPFLLLRRRLARISSALKRLPAADDGQK